MFETLRNRFALPQGWQPYQFFKPKVILSFVGLILAAAFTHLAVRQDLHLFLR